MVTVTHEKMNQIISEYKTTSNVMWDCCDQWCRLHNDNPKMITRYIYISEIRNIATYGNIGRYKKTTDFTLYDLKKW